MFDLTFTPDCTAQLFKKLAKIDLMANFVLIGGTALSIQIGHRLSEDLDFWLPMDQMPGVGIDHVVDVLRTSGSHVQLATPAWRISQAKINGQDLLSMSRDYVVDGVKLTFFARKDAPYLHFSKMSKVKQSKTAFDIMSSDAIFEMKSWLISQRIRSRDLFDLMVMVQGHGKTIRDILDAGQLADASYSREYAKEVLLGNVPIDAEDEGFESIELGTHIDDIYQYFSKLIANYEQDVATEILRTPNV